MAVEKNGLRSGSESNGSATDKSTNSGKESSRPAVRRTSRGTAASKTPVKTVVTRAKKNAAEAKKNNAKQPKEKNSKEPEANKAEDSGDQDSKTSCNDVPEKVADKKNEDVSGKDNLTQQDEDPNAKTLLLPSLALDSSSDVKDSASPRDAKGGDDSPSNSDVVCVDSFNETAESSSALDITEDKDSSDFLNDSKEEIVDVDAEGDATAKGDKSTSDDTGQEDDDSMVEIVASDPVADEKEAGSTPGVEHVETKSDNAEVMDKQSPSPKEVVEVRKSARTLKVVQKSVASERASSKDLGNDSSKNGSKTATKSTPEAKEKGSEAGTTEKDLGEKVKRIMPSDKTLWVSSLSNKTRAADLKALFSKHGKVSTAKILTNSKTPGSRCYGLVTMFSSKDALACIEHLHHTELHGRVISVEKTRLSIKKQPTVSNKTVPTEEEKLKSEKVSDKDDSLSLDKSQEENDSKDPKIEDKKLEKMESSHEGKVKKEDGKKTGVSKGESKLSPKSKRSLSPRKSSKEKCSRSRNRSRTSRERLGTSRTHSRSSREKNRSSKDRSRSRNRLTRVQPRFQDRRRSRSPFYRNNRPFNQSRSPLGRNNFYRDRDRNNLNRNFIRPRINTDYDSYDVDREMERKNRQETLRLERERERLRLEREELEREKARVLRLEKEHQRLERQKLENEMEELRKYSMILNLTERQSPKRSLNRDEMWDDRKRSRIHDRSSSLSGRESRHDGDQSSVSRFYDSSSRRLDRQSYHGGSSGDAIERPPTWNSAISQDQSKYGSSPIVPGIWARMDVPPPPIPQTRWGSMEQPRVQHPGQMGHQPAPTPMVPPPNQVVMFVGNNPNSSSAMTGQYPSSSRFNSNNGRRF